ncbi:hypothetical protein FS837_001305 [Tulasnella sp. UAMH 9824]|nr:hypothetical protein FS837_001305 [Tulasnella sp. UAMH 9824]
MLEINAAIDVEKPSGDHELYLVTCAASSKPLTEPHQVLDEKTLALINGPLLAMSLGEDRSRAPIPSTICSLGEAKVRTPIGSTTTAPLGLNVDLHYFSSYQRLTPDSTPLKDGTSTLRHEQAVLAWLIHSHFHFAPPSVNKGHRHMEL